MQVDFILRKVFAFLFLLEYQGILKISFSLKYLRQGVILVLSLEELKALAPTRILLGDSQTLLLVRDYYCACLGLRVAIGRWRVLGRSILSVIARFNFVDTFSRWANWGQIGEVICVVQPLLFLSCCVIVHEMLVCAENIRWLHSSAPLGTQNAFHHNASAQVKSTTIVANPIVVGNFINAITSLMHRNVASSTKNN